MTVLALRDNPAAVVGEPRPLAVADPDTAPDDGQPPSAAALGGAMRELRENVLGVSQTEAARLIGMEQSELSRIENGVGSRGPSYTTIARIIEAYHRFLHANDPGCSLGLGFRLRRPGDPGTRYRPLAGSC